MAGQKCARESESDVEDDDGEDVSLVSARKDEVRNDEKMDHRNRDIQSRAARMREFRSRMEQTKKGIRDLKLIIPQYVVGDDIMFAMTTITSAVVDASQRLLNRGREKMRSHLSTISD